MAKKTTKTTAATPVAKAPVPEVTTTPVRNTTVPPKSAGIAVAAKKSPPTRDDVRLRAYFIWQSSGGGEFENWIRAERELGI